MSTYKVTTIFTQGTYEWAVEADGADDAKRITVEYFASNDKFVYVDGAYELDGAINLVPASAPKAPAATTHYQVCAVFKDGLRYPAVEADSEEEAMGRADHAFAPDNDYYYCESATELDCLLTREEFPYPPTVAKPGAEISFKDRMLTYLYSTYPQYYRVIAKYVTAVEYVDADRGLEVQWEYFINEDGTLHTDLVDEDFTYYRDNMYPNQVYSCH